MDNYNNNAIWKMSIKYYKSKSGKVLASLPSGEYVEGIYLTI